MLGNMNRNELILEAFELQSEAQVLAPGVEFHEEALQNLQSRNIDTRTLTSA